MAKTKRRTGHETIRASIVIDVATYVRWGAASALARVDRSTFAVNAIADACKGVFVIDRRKPAGPVKTNESAVQETTLDPDGTDAA